MPDPDTAVTLYWGAGCDACVHTGYKGRTALFEVLPMGPEVAEAVLQGSAADEL
jgi:type II secretory ATPase GspE/PulE/Tfp pilus assembly ATPase PilB-like protein